MTGVFEEAATAVLAPRLKALGFAKSGLTWNRTEAGFTDVISIQKDRQSTPMEIRFTVNLALAAAPCKRGGRAVESDAPFHRRRRLVEESIGGEGWWRVAPVDLAIATPVLENVAALIVEKGPALFAEWRGRPALEEACSQIEAVWTRTPARETDLLQAAFHASARRRLTAMDEAEGPQRRLAPGKLVVASHNEGKVREIRELLAPFGIETISAGELDLPEPEETETTYTGNARLKAHAAAQAAGLPALADDSGLSIDLLRGDPGIYSARWAETESGRDFALGMERVWHSVTQTGWHVTCPKRIGAAFHCALSLAWPDGQDVTFLGTCPGRLVWPPRGNQGFGYDPMFVPLNARGPELTFGEMDPAAKHAISHRADAFQKLVAACLSDPADAMPKDTPQDTTVEEHP